MAHADITNARFDRSDDHRGFFTRFFDGLIGIAEANHRVKRVQHLNALSDAELAKRGIRREDIARHVFGDILYI
ncbi:DUF1127 domain-containing protein [Roseivivax sediminis]|uniref:DUF1127 domain-containing protein n=1 Tax=Roseivivax sediminis TaxID=936889 RepID=A0A1I2DX97_9RHOB|nr:DUF1127 domain-containing protein [Roseivivax sediminis]SFE85058.1 protein of unknown function [Roseivivax sediminis]